VADDKAPKTLAEALPEQIQRVNQIIELYMSIPMGQIAAALMKRDVALAQTAIRSHDAPAMLIAYSALIKWEV
jgi:hypothetical protein